MQSYILSCKLLSTQPPTLSHTHPRSHIQPRQAGHMSDTSDLLARPRRTMRHDAPSPSLPAMPPSSDHHVRGAWSATHRAHLRHPCSTILATRRAPRCAVARRTRRPRICLPRCASTPRAHPTRSPGRCSAARAHRTAPVRRRLRTLALPAQGRPQRAAPPGAGRPQGTRAAPRHRGAAAAGRTAGPGPRQREHRGLRQAPAAARVVTGRTGAAQPREGGEAVGR